MLKHRIGLIPLVVPFNFLCSYIGLCLSFHSHPVEACTPQQNLHVSLPFEKVETLEEISTQNGPPKMN